MLATERGDRVTDHSRLHEIQATHNAGRKAFTGVSIGARWRGEREGLSQATAAKLLAASLFAINDELSQADIERGTKGLTPSRFPPSTREQQPVLKTIIACFDLRAVRRGKHTRCRRPINSFPFTNHNLRECVLKQRDYPRDLSTTTVRKGTDREDCWTEKNATHLITGEVRGH